MRIKVETKAEWLKAMIDGAVGYSDLTDDDNAIKYINNDFLYKDGRSILINCHTKNLEIEYPVKTKTVYEFMYKLSGSNDWVINTELYSSIDECREIVNDSVEVLPTGRQFEVPYE
jgi:hypothetical protein